MVEGLVWLPVLKVKAVELDQSAGVGEVEAEEVRDLPLKLLVVSLMVVEVAEPELFEERLKVEWVVEAGEQEVQSQGP